MGKLLEFSLNMQKKKKSGGFGKSEAWNVRSLIVPLIEGQLFDFFNSINVSLFNGLFLLVILTP